MGNHSSSLPASCQKGDATGYFQNCPLRKCPWQWCHNTDVITMWLLWGFPKFCNEGDICGKAWRQKTEQQQKSHEREHESEHRSIVSDYLRPHDYVVHGILQARILEWVAVPSSRGSFQPRDWTQVSHIAGGFFTSWATREVLEYWSG